MTHDITLTPTEIRPFFEEDQDIIIRPAGQSYRLGDYITLQEHLPHRNEYTDRSITFRILSITEGTGGNGVSSGEIAIYLVKIDPAKAPRRPERAMADTKPAEWTVHARVLEVTPATQTVEDQHGEIHLLQGRQMTAEGQVGDVILLTMTPMGFQSAVIARPCKGHEWNPVDLRCFHCGLPRHADHYRERLAADSELLAKVKAQHQ